MITIDLPQARQLLAQAVETQGRDFRYNNGTDLDITCKYIPDVEYPDTPQGKTGCLIGVALGLAGVDPAQLVDGSVLGAHGTWEEEGVVNADEDALDYFQAAQTAQDNGRSWGEAYDIAESGVA